MFVIFFNELTTGVTPKYLTNFEFQLLICVFVLTLLAHLGRTLRRTSSGSVKLFFYLGQP